MSYIEEYAKATGREDWADMLSIIPPHMVDGMVRYITRGISGGSFMTALLSGDLFEAMRRADDSNLYALPSYARFLMNASPSGCYGSAAAVDEWIQSGGIIGMKENGV